jgi:NADH-quinone oxidoreductase subunit K
LILLIIALELILLSINMMQICYSVYYNDIKGSIGFILILTVAGAETALGLALILIYYRLRGSIQMDILNILKG